MNIFLDTSSLIKLYHFEVQTEYIDSIFVRYPIKKIFISELSKIEFESAVWKKIRTNQLQNIEGSNLINAFRSDYQNFHFIKINSSLLLNAQELISKYGEKGLRTLDSIILSSVISVKDEISFVVCLDSLLNTFIKNEGIEIK